MDFTKKNELIAWKFTRGDFVQYLTGSIEYLIGWMENRFQISTMSCPIFRWNNFDVNSLSIKKNNFYPGSILTHLFTDHSIRSCNYSHKRIHGQKNQPCTIWRKTKPAAKKNWVSFASSIGEVDLVGRSNFKCALALSYVWVMGTAERYSQTSQTILNNSFTPE